MANLVPVDFDPFASSDGAQPRGVRNNNPLNIEAGSFTQSQPGFSGSDGRFARFESPDQGFAAAENLLNVYGQKHGINTVAGVINRWAPSSDGNPVNAYAAHVARSIGVDPNQPIDLRDPAIRAKMADAMATFENGRPVPRTTDMSAQARQPNGGTPQLVPVDHDPFAGQPQGQPQQAEQKDPRASTKLYVGSDNFNDRFTGEPAPKREAPGVAESVARGALQGASFGFGDELQGATNAGLAGLDFLPEPAKQVIKNLPVTMDAAAVAGIARILYETYQGEPGDATKAYNLTVANERQRLADGREAHPIASTAGEVAGALAVPVGGMLNAATMPARIGRGAAVGATTGALYGAGQGEGLEGRAHGAAIGGGIGGVLGGAGAALLGPRIAGPAAQAGPDVVAAAERIGVQLPKAVASDSRAVQQVGKIASNVPVAGLPLRKASDRAIKQIGAAADNVQAGLGSGEVAAAGQSAREGIENYIGKVTADKASALYNKVDDLVNPTVTTPLNATRQTVNTISGRRTLAALGDSPAAANVMQALERPEGLTYEGIKQLRTSIGEMMKGGLLPANISQAELKQLYGALTQDLRASVQAAGGGRALPIFDRANRYYELVSARRENLMRIAGAKSDEGVFTRLVNAAGSTASADINLLSQARKALQPDEWNEVASAVIARIGRDAEGSFSPDRFITGWGKLSTQGKSVLFGGEVRKALDDIATVSSRFKQLQQYANPSGTGQTVMGGALGAGAITSPILALKVAVPAAIMSYALSRPATAKSVSAFTRGVTNAVRMPAVAAKQVISKEADRLSVVLSKELGVPQLASDLSRSIQGAVYSRADQEDSKP